MTMIERLVADAEVGLFAGGSVGSVLRYGRWLKDGFGNWWYDASDLVVARAIEDGALSAGYKRALRDYWAQRSGPARPLLLWVGPETGHSFVATNPLRTARARCGHETEAAMLARAEAFGDWLAATSGITSTGAALLDLVEDGVWLSRKLQCRGEQDGTLRDFFGDSDAAHND